MTRVMALEWGGDCIRVNSISPGPIAGTEGAKRLSLPGSEEKAIESIPLKRMGTKDDIAWLAMFLASPLATYISGAVIPCDGGGAVESVKPTLEEAAGAALAKAKQVNPGSAVFITLSRSSRSRFCTAFRGV